MGSDYSLASESLLSAQLARNFCSKYILKSMIEFSVGSAAVGLRFVQPACCSQHCCEVEGDSTQARCCQTKPPASEQWGRELASWILTLGLGVPNWDQAGNLSEFAG